MTSRPKTEEPGPPSLEVQRGFQLFLGGLGQSLSRAASVRHAAWWSDCDLDELNALIEALYPQGIEEERHDQILAYRRWADLRAEAQRLFDLSMRNGKTGLAEAMDRINWLLDQFPVNDAGFLMRVINDRELYWKKKSLFHVFLAGRADPVHSYPDRLQASLPEGMVFWRGL